jgi:CAAX prenyl protease-like protein
MEGLRALLNRSPLWIRVAPFLIFIILTAGQGKFGPASYYWVYAAKTLAGVFLVWAMWPIVKEMRWAFSWESVVVGVAIFVFWVGLDAHYPKFGKIDHFWNPHEQFGHGSALAWAIILIRILGSSLVVPPLEEVFYRSFVYRYIVNPDFEKVPLGVYSLQALLISAAIFGIAHYQWLPGILCALAYQGLVIKKKRLGDAMTAHAITNFLLGLYVPWKGQWQFW